MLAVSRLALRNSSRPMLRSAVASPVFIARRGLFEGYGVPQPPGNIVGTVNDAVPTPAPDAVHGSYHWTFERMVAVGLVPLTVLPVATGTLSPALDALFGGLLIAHCITGFQSCITDYIPTRKFPRGHKVCNWLLYIGSAGALYGVYKIETEEEGITGAVKKIWNA